MLKPKDLCPRAGTRTFLEAMQAGKVHLARFVLDALDRSIIDCRAEQGRTPLMVAVGLPDPAMRSRFVRLLLEQGAAVNLRDERGRTALSLACERGHLDAVQLLVQFSGDPEATDSAGNSPVMWAAACGHGAVLEFLVRSFRQSGDDPVPVVYRALFWHGLRELPAATVTVTAMATATEASLPLLARARSVIGHKAMRDQSWAGA